MRVFHIQFGGMNRISGVTIKRGAALNEQDGYGGNISMDHGANLTLDHVRVTSGVALHGGGIATGGGGDTIVGGLVDPQQPHRQQRGAQARDTGTSATAAASWCARPTTP